MYKNRRNQSGQAVLIILLSLSVVLIIVLYIMSRSVTDLSLSSKEENSLRAFSAAEAGIERALIAGSTGPSGIDGASFNATVTEFGEGEQAVVYPFSLKSGEIANFWFIDELGNTFFTGNNLKICWGIPGTTDDEGPAIEITIYYGLLNNPQIARITRDPSASRRALNNFGTPSNSLCTIETSLGTETFQFQESLNFPSMGVQEDLLYASVRVLYNNSIAHKVAVDVKDSGLLHALPTQGSKISSSGSYLDSNRKIEVYEVRRSIPPIFESALFSSNGIVK